MKKNNDRVGIFGGTFNPLHRGHLSCIDTAHSRLKLDRVVVVPAAQSPLKPEVEGPDDKQRLRMLEIGLAEFPFVEIDAQELERGGISYSIQTVSEYAKSTEPENLYLIVGADQFENFDKWKDFASILKICNVAVVARPNFDPPYSVEDFPAGLRSMVAAFDRSFVQLETGRHIEFLRIPGLDISSSEIRKRMRTSRGVEKYLSIPVEEYLRSEGLYGPLGPKIGDFAVFTNFCMKILEERKAISAKGYDLQGLSSASDYALVASGTSTRHAAALAENVLRAVKDEYNVFPQSVEGLSEGRWVLLDYGSLIVHVFYDFVRQEYRIEDLWRAAKPLPPKAPE